MLWLESSDSTMRKLNQPTAARLVKQENGQWYILWRIKTDEGTIRYRYKNGLNRIKDLNLREQWANKIVSFINAAALNGQPPSQNDVELHFDASNPPLVPSVQEKKPGSSFADFFDSYLNLRQKLVSDRTTIYRRTVLNNLNKLAVDVFKKQSLDWIDFDGTFPVTLMNWAYKKPREWSQNNVSKTLKVLTLILSEAENQGYDVGKAYKQKNYRLSETPVDSIALSFLEVKKLANLDLENASLKMQRVRDVFVLDCLCGLRYCDLVALTQSNFKPLRRHKDGVTMPVIETIQQKTGGKVIVPLHPISQKILKRNQNKLPKTYSNQRMNDYLKELGKLAGLKSEVILRGNKAGKMTLTKYRKYEVITCHTARRTFATIAFVEWNMPSALVMQATGHKSERDFLKYIKVVSEQAAVQMFDYFQNE